MDQLRRKEAEGRTSVDVLVGHAKVVLAGLLTTTNPLHTVLPPLDVAFQEDPSVAEEIVLGKVGRVLSVRTRLVHAHETLRKVNIPRPLAVGKKSGREWRGTMGGCTRRTQGYSVVGRSSLSSGRWGGGGFEGGAEGGGLEMESTKGGGLLLYTIGSVGVCREIRNVTVLFLITACHFFLFQIGGGISHFPHIIPLDPLALSDSWGSFPIQPRPPRISPGRRQTQTLPLPSPHPPPATHMGPIPRVSPRVAIVLVFCTS